MPGQFAHLANQDGTDLSYTDPLTGLGNIKRFFDKVDRLIHERRRIPRRSPSASSISTDSSPSTICSAARRATTSSSRWPSG
jgi:GGDEF domain-containing protein